MNSRAWVLLSVLPLSIIKWNKRVNNWKEYQVCSSPKGFSSTYIIGTLRVRTTMYIIGSSLIASFQQDQLLLTSLIEVSLMTIQRDRTGLHRASPYSGWTVYSQNWPPCNNIRENTKKAFDGNQCVSFPSFAWHFKANLSKMYIGCGNTFTHRAFVQPLHKICRSMCTQHSKVLIECAQRVQDIVLQQCF